MDASLLDAERETNRRVVVRFFQSATEHEKLRIADRFWQRVAKGTDPDSCWNWQGGRLRLYGSFNVAGKTIATHVTSWLLAHGDVPLDAFICHRCDNGLCVRPDHLFLGNAAINMQDKAAKGRCNTPTGDRHGSHTHPGLMKRVIRERATLTPSDVLLIRREYRPGQNLAQAFAKRFNVTPRHIRAVMERRCWKDIEEADR